MRIKQYLLAVCIGAMFAACSSKDDFTNEAERIPIKFSANIQNLIPSVGTRVGAGTSGLSFTEFPDDSEISVGFYGSGNSVIKKTDGNWDYTGDKLYFPLSGEGTVIGLYPKQTQSVASVMHGYYSSPTDQSELSNYQLADILGAATTISSSTPDPVSLVFKHLGSKIVVKLSGSSIPSSFTIKMKNIITTGMYGLSGTTLTINSMYGSNAITFGNYSSSGQTAIIIPQTIAENTALFEVGTGETTYTYTTSEAITFKAGHEYTFNFTFSQTAISLTNVTMTDWGTDPDKSTPIEGNLVK